MPKNKIFFLTLLFMCGVTAVWAATVTNNGNMTVRVQYKTPDGQYEYLSYVKPGETVDVPGGVEKVRIVRDPGEWAAPLKPGEVLDVEVKEGEKVTGKMTWYGDKIFFDGLTEGPPAISVGTVSTPQIPEPPKIEKPTNPEPEPTSSPASDEKPAATETPEPPAPSNWPWYSGIGDYLFILQLLVLGLPFVFLWYRHLMQPEYYIEGEWIESSRLGWGWGWLGSGGCVHYALMNGFFVGLALGAIALWGHSSFSQGFGFLQLFGQELYS